MKDFNVGNLKYGDVINTVLGKEIWEFLNVEEIVIRMETASYLTRPALEAIQPQLLERFDKKEISKPRYKQLMGIMAKQVMGNRGYMVAKSGVKIRVNEDLFKTATRYQKK